MNSIINPVHKSLILLISFCMLLLMVRMKITHSVFYGFLIWNLFLATVPFLISERIKKFNHSNRSNLKLIFGIFTWLIFLPNAPYIITDFIHLHYSKSNLVWLDIFLLFTFSSTGLLLAILSLSNVYKIIKEKWSLKFAHYFSILATFLCGFGIYLGRFLRFNSWDIFTSPITIVKKSILSTKDPKTWFITFAFGSFIYLLFFLFQKIKNDALINHQS